MNNVCSHSRQSQSNDVIMSAMASQVTSLTSVYSTVYSRRRSKKPSKLLVTGLCAGNSPVSGKFPAQMVSNAENVSIWWRHHDQLANRLAGTKKNHFFAKSQSSLYLFICSLMLSKTKTRWIQTSIASFHRAKYSNPVLWCHANVRSKRCDIIFDCFSTWYVDIYEHMREYIFPVTQLIFCSVWIPILRFVMPLPRRPPGLFTPFLHTLKLSTNLVREFLTI